MKCGQFKKALLNFTRSFAFLSEQVFHLFQNIERFSCSAISGYIVRIPYIVQKHLVNENSFARKTEETAFEEKGGVKNKPEYRGHHRNLAAKQRHYRVPSFHASSSSSSSSSSSLYQVRSNFRISLHSLQRIDIINIQSIHISGMKRERGRRDRGRKIHCLFHVSVSFLCKMFIHC